MGSSQLTFQHSQLAAYLVATAAGLSWAVDSYETVIERYHGVKRWWWFIAGLGLATYLYARPFIRVGLGSASRAHINFTTCYLAWLCGAVFYHLPSLKTMGIDIRADLSMFIVVYMASLAVLSLLWLLHVAAIRLGVRRLGSSSVPPGAHARHVVSMLLLNSATLALACSSYHSICGNGLLGAVEARPSAAAHRLRTSVCAQWLHPMTTSQYPTFAAWMLYGESASPPGAAGGGGGGGHGSASGARWAALDVAPNLTRGGGTAPPSTSVLSPVLTMWVTLILVYLVTSVADHAAAQCLHAAHMGELRKTVRVNSGSFSSMLRKYGPRKSFKDRKGEGGTWGLGLGASAGAASAAGSGGGGGTAGTAGSGKGKGSGAKNRGALDVRRPIAKALGRAQPSWAAAATAWGRSVLRSRAVQTLVKDTGWIWDRMAFTYAALGWEDLGSAAAALQRATFAPFAAAAAAPLGGSPAAGPPTQSGQEGAASEGEQQGEVEPPQPEFLPMVPWYSGTSADLLKTCFDLLVSVKLFLGRFDMRTMQAATAASMADTFNEAPSEGDGFTYEQYDQRGELWIDFIADTGDGGHPTYTVARALATPRLRIRVPPKLSSGLSGALGPKRASLGQMGEAAPLNNRPNGAPAGQAVGGGAVGASPPAQLPGLPPRPGVPSMVNENGHTNGASPAVAPSHLTLPRGDVLLLGGDLAYPNPTKETYEQRLLRPFSDALPPPPHYHPERLCVHKPDLPPTYGVQEAALPGGLRGLSPRASRHAAASALRTYPGPSCYAIPGNHDWVDGLETYIHYILHKGWLGGWLLPQEKSYFALKLPHGWWVMGLDLALTEDIDMCQLRYFANVVEQRLAPDDNVIIMTHQPVWLLDWFWQDSTAPHMRQLIRGHLRGRARVHLAGDLHFFMRHSFMRPPPPPQPTVPSAAAATWGPTPPVTAAPTPVKKPSSAGLPPAPATSALSSLFKGAAMAGGVGQDCKAPLRPPPQPVRELPLSAVDALSGVVCSTTPDSSTCSREEPGPLPPLTRVSCLSAPALGRSAPGGSKGGSPSVIPTLLSAANGGGPAAGLVPSPSIVGGSSDDESESGFSTVSGRSVPQLKDRGGYRNRGLRALGRHLPRLHIGDGSAGAGRPPGLPAGAKATGGAGSMGIPSQTLGAEAGRCAGCQARSREMQYHTFDPEHLIVNGAGGAFLHPTHVFAPAAFRPMPDPASEATAALYSAATLPCTCRLYPFDRTAVWGGGGGAGGWHSHGTYSSPSPRPPPPPPPSAAAKGAAALTSPACDPASAGMPGYYTCQVAYPTPQRSLELGRRNLHLFRLKNTRFDVIGGLLYFLLVVSVMPRCSQPGPVGAALLASTRPLECTDAALGGPLPCNTAPTGGVAAVLDAETHVEMLVAMAAAYLDAMYDIFMRSHVSLGVACLLTAVCVGLARGGGVGAVRSEDGGRSQAGGGQPGAGPTTPGGPFTTNPRFAAPRLSVRVGGLGVQLAWGGAHALAHVSVAVILLLILELGVEMCIRHEQLGQEGLHSLYRWYLSFEAEHFPDPQGVRQLLKRATLGLYPGVIKAVMAVFDLPEAVAVTRISACAAGGSMAGVSRLQAAAYHGGMLAYYWLLATPAVGAVFGLYLYTSVVWGGVHYDEAFSSLRIASHKSLTRMHITPEGDLEIYTVAADRVPGAWREDPRWRSGDGGGGGAHPSHAARFPSRWLPAWPRGRGSLHGPWSRSGGRGGHGGGDGSSDDERQVSPKSVQATVRDGKPAPTRGGVASPFEALRTDSDDGVDWKLVDYLKVPRQRAA